MFRCFSVVLYRFVRPRFFSFAFSSPSTASRRWKLPSQTRRYLSIEDEGTRQSFVARHQMNWTQRLDSDHQMIVGMEPARFPLILSIGKDGIVVQQ
jgi:hypothetical protein